MAIWSSWKAQMEAVASAGFMAIAPDMRGYGGSSAPVQAEAYTPYQTVGDLVSKTEGELNAIPNFGKKSIDEVIETLHTRGLDLRQD